MKKTALLLALLMLISAVLSACGGNEDGPGQTGTEKTGDVSTVSVDNSYS